MEQKHLHYGHRERLRKQVQESGLESLHEHQVLEYLLTFVLPQKDTNELAHQLINKFGSFAGTLEADVNSLKQVKGVGEVVSHFLSEFRSFYIYYQKRRKKPIEVIKDMGSAKQFILPLLSNLNHEEVYMIGMDGNNKVVLSKRVSVGGINQANVTVRIMMDELYKHKVSNFIMAHNHPTGPSVPSAEDNKFTKALVFGLAVGNINFLDHLIVGTDGVFSYHHEGLLQSYKDEACAVLGISGSQIAQGGAKYGDER